MARSNSRQIRLPTICKRLQEIDVARGYLLRQLAELDAESHALNVEHRSIINENAAIYALPNELISTIFELGHAQQALGERFEILVASVTKHWRDVALRTPKLWNVISCTASGRQLECTALYLSRSKAAPIDLSIDVGCHNKTGDHDIGDICQLFRSHFARCDRLVVDSMHCACLDHLTKLLCCLHDVSAPLLCKIVISRTDMRSHGNGDVFPPQAQIFTGGAPMLNSISLYNIGLQCCLPPLGSVTTIYLCGVSPSTLVSSDEWLNMISSATSLVHLEMDGDAVVHDWVPSVAFEMPALRSLALEFHGDGNALFYGILECIIAPRLEVLALKTFTPDDTVAFHPNPFPSLHTLILQNIYTLPGGLESFENILAAFPDIQHIVCGTLDHRDHGIYDNFFSLLTPGKYPNQTLMPCLRTIALLSVPDTVPWSAVRDLLVTRTHIRPPIRKLFVAANHMEEVSTMFPATQGIVHVEQWKRELVLGWPAWTSLP